MAIGPRGREGSLPGGNGLFGALRFGQNRRMADELWRPSLDLALHRNRPSPDARYVQLATLRENHRPAVRTLVFRGFLGDTNHLTFATDGRSEKVVELEHSPWAEACWYFPQTREQFRFLGDHDARRRRGPQPGPERGSARRLACDVRRVTAQLHVARPRSASGCPDHVSRRWPPIRSSRCPTSASSSSRPGRSTTWSSTATPSIAGNTPGTPTAGGRASRSIPEAARTPGALSLAWSDPSRLLLGTASSRQAPISGARPETPALPRGRPGRPARRSRRRRPRRRSPGRPRATGTPPESVVILPPLAWAAIWRLRFSSGSGFAVPAGIGPVGWRNVAAVVALVMAV